MKNRINPFTALREKATAALVRFKEMKDFRDELQNKNNKLEVRNKQLGMDIENLKSEKAKLLQDIANEKTRYRELEKERTELIQKLEAALKKQASGNPM